MVGSSSHLELTVGLAKAFYRSHLVQMVAQGMAVCRILPVLKAGPGIGVYHSRLELMDFFHSLLQALRHHIGQDDLLEGSHCRSQILAVLSLF